MKAQDKFHVEGLILQKMPELYLMMLSGVEQKILKSKAEKETILSAIWLNEEGGINNMAFKLQTGNLAVNVHQTLDELVQHGVPGGPERPLAIASAAMFVCDSDRGQGVSVVLRSGGFHAEQFSELNEFSHTLSMKPLEEKNIRWLHGSSTSLH
jgi:hypothetical protein